LGGSGTSFGGLNNSVVSRLDLWRH
jgi:hypothetical protein